VGAQGVRVGRHRPAEDPLGLLRQQVDAAVAARPAVVVVPVGAVKGDPAAGEVRGPAHAGQVVVIVAARAARHARAGVLAKDAELAAVGGKAAHPLRRAELPAGRRARREHRPVILVRGDGLRL